MSRKRTYVLVHGAWWAGEWIWQAISDRLRKKGHKVFVPVLTGLGSRSHLVSSGIDLSTHIEDVVNVIKFEELEDIVLVGHSYAGMVISGVAEQLDQGRIHSIVYLDAFYPEDGDSLSGLAGNYEDVAPVGIDLTPPPLFFAGNDESLREVLERRGTPHPRACFEESVVLKGARDGIENKHYIWAKNSPVFTEFYAKLKENGAWKTHTLPCAHFTMLDLPKQTTDLLLRASK